MVSQKNRRKKVVGSQRPNSVIEARDEGRVNSRSFSRSWSKTKKKDHERRGLAADEYDDDSCTAMGAQSKTELSEISAGSSTINSPEMSEAEKVVFDDTVRQLFNIAMGDMKKGNKQKSIDTFGEILERVRKKFKPNHHRVGAALHNLGYSQLVAGQYEKAVFSLKNAVSIREHTFDCHPLVVESLIELGAAQLCLRQFEDSLDTFLKALDFTNPSNKAPLSQQYYDLTQAKIYNNIGCVYYEWGEMSWAEDVLKASLSYYNRYHSNQNNALSCSFYASGVEKGLGLASVLCNTSYIRLNQKKNLESLSLLVDALKIQKKMLKSSDIRIAQTLDNIGYSNVQLNNYEAALQNYKEIHEIESTTLSKYHKNKIVTLKKMLYAQLKLLKYEEAHKTVNRIIDIEEKNERISSPEKDEDDNEDEKNAIGRIRKLLTILELRIENMGLWDAFLLEVKNLDWFASKKQNKQDEEELDVAFFEIACPVNKSHLIGQNIRAA